VARRAAYILSIPQSGEHNEQQPERRAGPTVHERGFLLGDTVLSDEEVEALRADTTRVIERQDEIPAERRPVQIVNLTGKGDAPVWQVVNIWQASDPFRALVEHPRIASDIAQLTGAAQVRLWHDQIQYKPAQTGGANMWHQDSPLWAPLQPKDQQVTAWVALDDVDEGNGCMWMAPGSHKWGPQMPFLNTIREFTQVPEFEGRAVPIVPARSRRGRCTTTTRCAGTAPTSTRAAARAAPSRCTT
jgi:ectoine hydroxylase-related dioxygenase (phytanoyl-CoA dioxygenase family)